MRASFILLVVGSLWFHRVTAEELQGADAVLKRLAEAAQSPGAKEKKKGGPVAELRDKMKAYARDAASMPPEQAAAQWLALYDRFAAFSRNELYGEAASYGEQTNFQSFVEILPPSAAWPALAQKIEDHKPSDNALADAVLRLFGSLLRGTPDARSKALNAVSQAIKKRAAQSSGNAEYLEDMMEQFTQYWGVQTGSDAERMEAFEKTLASHERHPENRNRGPRGLSVPDLVRMGGKAKAEPLLERVLKLDEEFNFEGAATQRLAAKAALKNISSLHRPLWELVSSEEDVPLYLALVAKFPEAHEGDPSRSQADMVYLLYLIGQRRTEEAAKLALQIMGEEGPTASLFAQFMGPHSRHGIGKPELVFLHEMLAHDASLPLWTDFVSLSAQMGQAQEALDFLKSSLAKPGVPEAAKTEMEQALYRALLAADKVDDGIEALRELIRASAAEKEPDPAQAADRLKESWSKFGLQPRAEVIRRYRESLAAIHGSAEANKVQLPLRLAELGRLLNRADLRDEGLAAAKAGLAEIPDENFGWQLPAMDLVRALVIAGKMREAEQLAVDQLARVVKPDPRRGGYTGAAVEFQGALMWIYLKNGRAADAVKLLEESPYWGQPDLAGIGSNMFRGKPLSLVAAQALATTGRIAEARKVAKHVVQEFPGGDGGYALVLSLGGEGLEKWLDEVFASDRFEERPLIWKAKLQLDAGRIAEAEKSARAAIAIDPSDGEEGKGDRMRAYAVLGDILEKKGDLTQAKIMRSAVSAIRLSEDADDWWQAGMLSHAIRMYEDALQQFADAYCIQSRLALRYSEQGDFAKAEQHYQRAFELMPESFGRIESHCFGCEGAFAGQRAQSIAERVFTSLAKKMPDRPQVFYLLGYLREEEGKFAEAGEAYRKAVALDPDYLNAWSRLDTVADSLHLSSEERDAITLALLRIDPAGKHSNPRVEEVHDLGKLWDVLLAAERATPQRQWGPIFPLGASRAVLQLQRPAENWNAYYHSMSSSRSPRRRFAESQPINAIATLLNMAEQMP